jgi:hypothetical protein
MDYFDCIRMHIKTLKNISLNFQVSKNVSGGNVWILHDGSNSAWHIRNAHDNVAHVTDIVGFVSPVILCH